MGREVRRVPPDWEHPRSDVGKELQPLYDEPFDVAAKRWKECFLAWEAGHNQSFGRPRTEDETGEYWEYESDPPDRIDYRPDWPEETRTHYQMYETCSEGTPISPVMETPEALARWLVDNNASAFAEETASYEAWLRIAKGGYAPSMIIIDGVMQSGVEGLS